MPDEVVYTPKLERDLEPYARALHGWMQEHMPDAESLRISELSIPHGIGHSNETVFYSASWREAGEERGARYVARIEPPDGGVFPLQTPACEISCELQYRMMDTVGRLGAAPVPRLVSFERDASVLGRPFFAMEFVRGQIPLDMPRYSQEGFIPDATPEQRSRLVFAGLDAMVGLHTIDWREAGLQWLDVTGGSEEPTLQHQLDVYREFTLRQLAGREHPVLMRTFEWLEANMPDAETGMSWGDARIGNQIHDDFRCAAVVDWEAASLGPREQDIGWWIMFDRMSYEGMGIERPPGMPSLDEQLAYYEDKRGQRIAGDIHYWEVFAVMRFDAIMVKLGDRAVSEGRLPKGQELAMSGWLAEQLDEMISR